MAVDLIKILQDTANAINNPTMENRLYFFSLRLYISI